MVDVGQSIRLLLRRRGAHRSLGLLNALAALTEHVRTWSIFPLTFLRKDSLFYALLCFRFAVIVVF